MTELSVLSTDGVGAAHRRVDFWNACAVETLKTPMNVDARDPDRFWGRIAKVDLNSIQVAEVSSGGATIRHTRKHVARSTTDSLQVLIQISGKTGYVHGGRQETLEAGDFTLLDSNQPYELTFDDPVASLVLTISRDELRPYIACPAAFAGVRLSGRSGASALTSRFLRDLWRHPAELLAAGASSFLDRALFDVIAAAYSSVRVQTQQSSQSMMRKVALIEYIESHLRDPELGPDSIAAAFRVTPRCIYRLLDSETETLSSYIKRRRVEESARSLKNPLLQGRNISSIAFDFGFTSIAHFSRVFRERFGVSPREYRRQERS